MGVANGRDEGQEADEHKGGPGAQALAKDATRHLEKRVPDDERLLDIADVELAQAEIRHHRRGRHRDGLLLYVSEKAEPEEKGEDAPANAKGRSRVQRHFPAGSSGLGFGTGLLLCNPASSINCLRMYRKRMVSYSNGEPVE